MSSPEDRPRSVIPINPIPVEEDGVMVSLYQAQQKIHPRSVQGVFARWRWLMVVITQLVFYGLPWLEWGQRQAVLFDLGARRFYIFGLVLYPQDFIYLTALLVISALSLFLFTAVAGRLWCGFACPQTVYTEIFIWIERQFEGDRSARMRLDDAPWNLNKVGRKTGKQLAWIVFSLWTGFSFVGYFTPIRELSASVLSLGFGPWEIFWILFYSFATYGNAGFMREQVCKYMCPYARFQSAMFDKDTLIVTYDEARGEPRGPRSKKADPKALGLGSCVDCTLCVQVCPTGIDIRKGLQYECIGCGACVDVCDNVMDKVGYDRGLIKFSTQNAMDQGWSWAQTVRRIFRPRVLIYTAVLWSIIIGVGVSLWLREPFKVDIVRDRATMARIVSGGKIENVYRLQIMNAAEETLSFHLQVEGLPGLLLASESAVQVNATESRWVSVQLQVPYDAAPSGSHPIQFHIEARKPFASTDAPNVGHLREKTVFLIPR
ncbi:cytochrome c oxidase accessory protein CcoG [Limnohabitans sp.]|uniref:cytochrome c oxidase accessory protein CcoG n=1 Tax=Limnohabitans sp. TaxID=1907725 RepID=UPI002AFFCE6F|nr:cytochrome c oxidase accessory protein CcoG [Limnohabitans sp.]